MQKKGVVEVDWIVSIGIFLIYLAFFFFYLTPLTQEQVDMSETLLLGVEKNLRDNATWNVQRVPIFIRSNLSSTEPVMAPFFLEWANLSFSDNTTFYRQENKIIFTENLREGQNLKWVVSSDEIYPQPRSLPDLSPTKNSVTIDGSRFQAEFDGLLTSAVHFDKQRVSGFSLKLDGSTVDADAAIKEYNFSNFAAKYKMSSETLNHTTFVVGNFPRLFNYVSPRQRFEPHNITLSVTLHNYTRYFIDESSSGEFNFTKKICAAKFSNYADFYDNLGGVTFITEDTANITFCTGNRSIDLSITMALSNEAKYEMIFHSGDYNETLKYRHPYTVKTGLAENLSGFSMALLRKLNDSGYPNLKSAWSFPTSRDFSFELLNESNVPLLNYSPESPGFVNIFIREFEEVLLDKYGNKQKYRLRVRGW